MATLVPRFNLPVQKPEVVFLCDRSGSMGGVQKIPNLVAAMGIFLKSLPVGVRFNICSFGTRFTFLWDKSQPYDQASLEKAIAHIRGFDADYGGTEIQRPMEEAFRRRHQDMNLEVILITDGEVWQQTAMFQSINAEVAQSNGSIRVFTLGIGTDTVSEDEKMDKKLVRMLKGALTPHVGDYTLEIRYEKEGSPRKAAGSDDGDDNDDSDGFELVEKVMDAMTIDVPDEVQENLEQEEQKIEKTTISLFDETVKDKDLEMPDATALPAVKLPAVIEPRYLQTPYDIPPLFPFIRTTVYVLLSDSTPACRPKSVLLRGTCDQAALELEIPILALAEEGTTIHQLAAKKEIGELEEGHGWIYHAKTEKGRPFKQEFEAHLEEMVKREAVRLGT
ncbi:von Willebrand factor A domain-containing protein [Escovopsis weberi]|uniref:von Willebrand factor A domain-containing protein n=1 Tax=Escovopsis weberi TaxID=150374 RepID=A0A0M8MVK0_ESCWE|nr:von Willebrand factor A domain-containing protein [Escovopsis weberi]